MTREELEAALTGSLSNGQSVSMIFAAARKQLALMPEKCGTCGGKGLQHSNPGSLCNHPCPTCHGSGKVYPQETVEKIHSAGIPYVLVVAVLDALGATWHTNRNTGELCNCNLDPCYVDPEWEPMTSGTDPSNGTE